MVFLKMRFLKKQGSSWLTVQMPFQIIPSNGKQETIAAVYLHTPVPEIQKLRTDVFRLFMISCGVGHSLSDIIDIYIFTKITKPLKQINNAAKIIAGGEFKNRLVVNTEDE